MTIKKVTAYLWVILNVCLGFALGWLVSFGFLNLDDPIIIFFISGSSAIVHAFITCQIIKKRKQKSTSTKIFLSIQLVIVFIIAGLYLSQVWLFQNKPVLSSNYETSFVRLWKAMDRAYPYFELKKVDWDEMYSVYYPKVKNVSDDPEYFDLIAQMLAEVEDAHTNVVSPSLQKRIFASVRNSGDLAIVDQIGYSAEIAGLRPGDLLLRINGKLIETTGGATGNPIQFSLPGGSVRYSTASFSRPDGQLVEGRGYIPDVVIDWTIEDYLKGIDPDIQAAIDWIEQQE